MVTASSDHGSPPPVSCPGVALQQALRGRGDLDLALLPSESVNDDGLFIDGMSLDLLRRPSRQRCACRRTSPTCSQVPAAA